MAISHVFDMVMTERDSAQAYALRAVFFIHPEKKESILPMTGRLWLMIQPKKNALEARLESFFPRYSPVPRL